MKVSEDGLYRLISNTVQHAIKENNMEGIEYMLTTDCFEGVSKEKLEKLTFSSSYHEFTRNNYDNALKYLIFEYKISEDNSINRLQSFIGDIDPIVKQMFETRKLTTELNEKLINNNTPIHRIKL